MTKTYDLITLGQSSLVRDNPTILDKGRELLRTVVNERVAQYEFFNCVGGPTEFNDILHQGPECAFENDDGEWIEFDYRHYHLSATWEVCHDLLVDKLQWLFKPFGETLEVKKIDTS